MQLVYRDKNNSNKLTVVEQEELNELVMNYKNEFIDKSQHHWYEFKPFSDWLETVKNKEI